MENKKIILIAGKGFSTNIVFHALNRRFNVDTVIIEEKESKYFFIKRRIKKLGILTVFGQIMFQFLIVPLLNITSKKQIYKILADNNLQDCEIPQAKIMNVKSINHKSVADVLISKQPAVIVVNGTRIISRKILTAIKSPFINTHAGITPMYRGVHGAYWALVNNDEENCGVTIHLVDPGIDTGEVIYQSAIKVNKKDTFISYPLKQLAAGIPLLMQSIDDSLNGELKTTQSVGKSELWYHPTIWQYLYFFIKKKVR
jgi:folate-dependent phosphoribosylglycinamide formyltransferase PurN